MHLNEIAGSPVSRAFPATYPLGAAFALL